MEVYQIPEKLPDINKICQILNVLLKLYEFIKERYLGLLSARKEEINKIT